MIRGGRRVVECLRFEFEQVLYKNSSPEKESTRQPRALGNPLDGTADEKKVNEISVEQKTRCCMSVRWKRSSQNDNCAVWRVRIGFCSIGWFYQHWILMDDRQFGREQSTVGFVVRFSRLRHSGYE